MDFIVHDNVFTLDQSIKLVELNYMKRTYSYFNRKQKPYKNMTEYMIDDYLTKLNDKSEIVEYWYRGRWVPVLFHQDLDEIHFKKTGEIITPNNGHVMYLSEYSNTAGTVLFNKDRTAISIVYPKIGRILRFDGALYHGIPNTIKKLHDSSIRELENVRRHVILFNTWNKLTITDLKQRLITEKIETIPQVNPIEEWVKVEIIDNVPLSNLNFSIEIEYIRKTIEDKDEYYVNKRFIEDGYHQRIISYQVENKNKMKNLMKE